MYTREEEGHVCRDPSGLVLEEDGAGVSSVSIEVTGAVRVRQQKGQSQR